MYQSSYKHHRIYAALLCLLTMNPIALGKQKSPTAAIMGNVHKEQPQTGNILLPTTVSEPMLTATQRLWLNETLKAQDSNKKRFRKLLANIAHKEEYVRGVACQKACQLLTEDPKLARKSTVNSLKKVLHRVSNSQETDEALQLLCLLVAKHPQLALPASSVVLGLASNGKNMLVNEGIVLNMLLPLTQTVIDTSPRCLHYLLHNFRKLSGSEDACHVTVQTLLVVHKLFTTNTVKENPTYLQQILETVLNSARSQDKVVASMAYTLLGEIAQEHPSLARRQISSMIALVQNEPPDMMATMEMLVISSAVDPSACEQIFALLTNIFRTTDVRIHGQAEQIYAAEKSKGLIIDVM